MIEPAALERIGAYVGNDPTFDSEAELVAYIRGISPFGPHDDAQWEHLVQTHDVAARATAATASSTIRASPCRFATRRRARTCGRSGTRSTARRCCCAARESDLLSASTARAMTKRGPRPRLVEFAGVGHAPTLIPADQVRAVVDFLRDD